MALKPIFARFEHSIDAWQWGLDKEDFHKVQEGYACGRCLEDFQGERKLVCPVCGETSNLVIDSPPEWKGKRE